MILRVGSVAAALLISVSQLRAQDAAHVVTIDGQPALRFSSTNGAGDVLVRRTTAPAATLTFDVAGAAINGKSARICVGTLKVSTIAISFASKEMKTPGHCRLIAALNAPLAELQEPRITSPPEQRFSRHLAFAHGGLEYVFYFVPVDVNQPFCRKCDMPPYEFLHLSLTAPEAALRRFENMVATSLGPASSSRSPQLKRLYDDFFNRRRTDPDSAYSAAKVFLAAVEGEPPTPEADFARQWVAAYEKVKAVR